MDSLMKSTLHGLPLTRFPGELGASSKAEVCAAFKTNCFQVPKDVA